MTRSEEEWLAYSMNTTTSEEFSLDRCLDCSNLKIKPQKIHKTVLHTDKKVDYDCPGEGSPK